MGRKKHILWSRKISSWETTNQIAMWILKSRVNSTSRLILSNTVALWKFKAALKMGWDSSSLRKIVSHYFEWYGLSLRVILMTSTINQCRVTDSKSYSSQMLAHWHIQKNFYQSWGFSQKVQAAVYGKFSYLKDNKKIMECLHWKGSH